jgi:hypothetical protein
MIRQHSSPSQASLGAAETSIELLDLRDRHNHSDEMISDSPIVLSIPFLVAPVIVSGLGRMLSI